MPCCCLHDIFRTYEKASLSKNLVLLHLMVILLILPAVKAESSACINSIWKSGLESIKHDGIDRSFRVHLPEGYDLRKKFPLILAFHGWGGDENGFLQHKLVREELDRRGYIMLAPLGLGRDDSVGAYSSWSVNGSTTGLDGDGFNPRTPGDSDAICDPIRTPDYTYRSCVGIAQNSCSWTHCLGNDLDFIIRLIDEANFNLCIDTDRIYAVGGSNGGQLVWELGQNTSTVENFAALASLIALPHRGYARGPANQTHLPIISITGMRDKVVPPGDWDQILYTTTSNGEVYYYTSATAITRVWAEAIGCSVLLPSQPVVVGYKQVDCRAWPDCNSDGGWPNVLDCRGLELGHDYEFEWSWRLIMDFFDQQTRT